MKYNSVEQLKFCNTALKVLSFSFVVEDFYKKLALNSALVFRRHLIHPILLDLW